jgi:hypothetical protein
MVEKLFSRKPHAFKQYHRYLLDATITIHIRQTAAATAHTILIQGPVKKKLSSTTPIIAHIAMFANRAIFENLFIDDSIEFFCYIITREKY